MSSNYQWQQQQANERIQARLNEASAHRQAKEGNDGGQLPVKATLFIPVVVGVIVLFFLLNSFTTSAVGATNLRSAVHEVPTWTMGQRIEFQDARDQLYAAETIQFAAPSSLTMADRIRFQDSLQAGSR